MGGKEDSFCHFDLMLNSRNCGVIDSCDTFSFCRDMLRLIALYEIVQGNLYLALESISLLAEGFWLLFAHHMSPVWGCGQCEKGE